MKFSSPIQVYKTVDLDNAIPRKENAPSSNMGASSISTACDKATWLDFHWCINDYKEPKMVRLLHLGEILEGEMAQLLRSLGMDLQYTGDDQIKVFIAPHFVCKPDGIIFSGVPTAEKTVHVWESKSSNKKHFEELQKKGLQNAKPEHYIQMQCEMRAASIFLNQKVERGFYTSYCKDNSELYAERIDFDESTLNVYLEKAERIRLAEYMPEGLSDNPNFEGCKYCNKSHFCHFTHEVENINCRTCIHSTPEKDGTWSCALDKKYGWGIGALSWEMQKAGCPYHSFRPDLVPWKLVPECSTEDAAAYERDGEILLNGLGGIPSTEFRKPKPRTFGGDVCF